MDNHPIEWFKKGGLLIKLFISRIPYSLTSTLLSDLFSPFGQVSSAKISIDGITFESLGCGYVEMADVCDGQTAIQKLNGSDLDGKTIGVTVASSNKQIRGNKA